MVNVVGQVIGLEFTESLGFEEMEISIELNKKYSIVDDFEGVYYILDDNGCKIGFEKVALDKTVTIYSVV